MRRQRVGTLMLVFMAALLIGWPLYQLFDLYHKHNETQNAVKLLHEVSVFQLELMQHDLREAAASGHTGGLNGLKQSAYAAQFTHQRLAMAAGGGLERLDSLDGMLQFILGAQIVGNRVFKASETEALQQAAETFDRLFAAYEGLIEADGKVDAAHGEALSDADRELAELIRGQLLE